MESADNCGSGGSESCSAPDPGSDVDLVNFLNPNFYGANTDVVINGFKVGDTFQYEPSLTVLGNTAYTWSITLSVQEAGVPAMTSDSRTMTNREKVDAGIATFERTLRDYKPPQPALQSRQVLLFSGHMIDAPGRNPPRFPPEKEAAAAQRIDEVLAQLDADEHDFALSQAAAGGDILFLEACLRRGLRCCVMLPFAEPEFIDRSILPSQGGEKWRDRYYDDVRKIGARPLVMQEQLGPLPEGVDPFEACNLWLLHTALAAGENKVRFVCLWNGGGGDGPGGTAHMYKEIQRRSGSVHWIDTRRL